MSELRALLVAVRRRLWRNRFAAAARLACWSSTAVLLLAMALHVAAGPVPAFAVGLALALTWAATMARALARRPDDRLCALWADRHLGGASAYGTWLDLGRGKPGTADENALRWLQRWVAAKVPDSLRRLERHREAARWTRPVLSLAASAALAAFVLTTPELAPSARPQAATSTSGNGDQATLAAAQPAAAVRAGDVAAVLRAARMRQATEQARNDQGSAARAGKAADGEPTTSSPTSSDPPPATLAGQGAAAAPARSGMAAESAAGPRSAQTAGGGAGREAGDGRDDSRDDGVGKSRDRRGTIATQRLEVGAQRPTADWQADMERSGTFDDELSTPHAAALREAAAAATAPAAVPAMALSPAETTYVHSWMKASLRRR